MDAMLSKGKYTLAVTSVFNLCGWVTTWHHIITQRSNLEGKGARPKLKIERTMTILVVASSLQGVGSLPPEKNVGRHKHFLSWGQ